MRGPARIAWVIAAIASAFTIGGVVAFAMRSAASTADAIGYALWQLPFLSFVLLGALLITHDRHNRIGLVLAGIGLSITPTTGIEQLARALLDSRWVGLGGVFAWLAQTMWLPGTVGLLVVLPLLFPTGRPPSPRWRALAWAAAAAALVATVPHAILAWPVRGLALLDAPDQSTIFRPGVWRTLDSLGLPFIMILAVLAVASLVFRYRQGEADQRLQLRWVLYAAAVTVVAVAIGANVSDNSATLLILKGFFNGVASAALPVAVAIAVLRYRLYDIDVVISKTFVAAGMLAFVTVVYVALVAGVGLVVGGGDRPNLALSVLATTIVAVAFNPIRDRLSRLVDRLVYGVRATPLQVLAAASRQLGESPVAEDALSSVVRTVAQGTGARSVGIFLRLADRYRVVAAWPAGELPPDELIEDPSGEFSDALPDFGGVDIALPIRHHGELLGALTATKPRDDPLRGADLALLEPVAAQAGLVLRNLRLTQELLLRLEELRSSRQRLVSAQDIERRRLERDLHDGAQQQLVALKIKLSLAETIAAESEVTELAELLRILRVEAGDAIDNLRALAHGIYPPRLAADGLESALRAEVAKSAVSTSIHASGLGRYAPEIEAAVYFCVLEALQNIAKYAQATEAVVTLHEDDGRLVFEVRDDGVGFDEATLRRGQGMTNMTDRLDALGGSISVTSRTGEGTRVAGSLPVAQPTAAAFAPS